MKNRPRGVIEQNSVTLNNVDKWDGKDVEIIEEEIDQDLLNQIMEDTRKDL